MNIVKIDSFRDDRFENAFKTYFAELSVTVRDWDGLFSEMDESGSFAFVMLDGCRTVGFIMLQQIGFESYFFAEQCGFVRELWIDGEYRHRGLGSKLLSSAEEYFGGTVSRMILTTDTAEEFYLKNGYSKAVGIDARNKDDVFVKLI